MASVKVLSGSNCPAGSPNWSHPGKKAGQWEWKGHLASPLVHLSSTRLLFVFFSSVCQSGGNGFVSVLKQNDGGRNVLNVIELTGGLHCFTGLESPSQVRRTSSLTGSPGLLDRAVMVAL